MTHTSRPKMRLVMYGRSPFGKDFWRLRHWVWSGHISGLFARLMAAGSDGLRGLGFSSMAARFYAR